MWSRLQRTFLSPFNTEKNFQWEYFWSINHRSIHRRYSVTNGVLKNIVKFTGKHVCKSLFLNKFAGRKPATLLKKRLWHRCFPVNFAKFLRTPFCSVKIQNNSGGCFCNKGDSSLNQNLMNLIWLQWIHYIKIHLVFFISNRFISN